MCLFSVFIFRFDGLLKPDTKEFISKTSLKACFCHAGLSGIFLQEGFPTSGNDIQVALLMTVLVIVEHGLLIALISMILIIILGTAVEEVNQIWSRIYSVISR